MHNNTFKNSLVRRLHVRCLFASTVSLWHLVSHRGVLDLVTVAQRVVAVLHFLVEVRRRQI